MSSLLFDISWGAILIGIGAVLSGVGSILVGIAALHKAHQEDKQLKQIPEVIENEVA